MIKTLKLVFMYIYIATFIVICYILAGLVIHLIAFSIVFYVLIIDDDD
jgi:hypothetical protein